MRYAWSGQWRLITHNVSVGFWLNGRTNKTGIMVVIPRDSWWWQLAYWPHFVCETTGKVRNLLASILKLTVVRTGVTVTVMMTTIVDSWLVSLVVCQSIMTGFLTFFGGVVMLIIGYCFRFFVGIYLMDQIWWSEALSRRQLFSGQHTEWIRKRSKFSRV